MNAQEHGKKMQTPSREDLDSWDSNPESRPFGRRALAAAPPFRPLQDSAQKMQFREVAFSPVAISHQVLMFTARRSKVGDLPGPLCEKVTCSPRVCVGFLRVIRFPPPVQGHTGYLEKLNCPSVCSCPCPQPRHWPQN